MIGNQPKDGVRPTLQAPLAISTSAEAGWHVKVCKMKSGKFDDWSTPEGLEGLEEANVCRWVADGVVVAEEGGRRECAVSRVPVSSLAFALVQM